MKIGNDILYIPPHMGKAVSIIARKPLTLIMAGSGYGKTTAVIDYLKHITRNTLYRWYTCFGEPPERAWQGLCSLISFADTRIGDSLSNFELPSIDHLGQIASLMSGISCENETILIIDNYQLMGFSSPYGLLCALSAHGSEKLHIVVLSQPLDMEGGLMLRDPRITYIPQETFCFTPDDVEKLFALAGVSLADQQIARLCAATEGWVAALRLHLSAFLIDGTLESGLGINELMELSFWRQLDERQKQLFLVLSLMDTFTETQAAHMLGRDVMPEELWLSVRGNAFVRRSGREYVLHSLLKQFLIAKFQTKSSTFCSRMYARAGEACQIQGKRVQAVLFFIQAGEDSSALSVPLTSVELAELVRLHTEPWSALLSRCRIELLEGRHLLLLGTAVKAGLNGKAQLAKTALSRLSLLRDLPGSRDEQRRGVTAALELAASFRAYNDIQEMSRHHSAAIALLDDPQDFYMTNDSWTFGVPSVVHMFWRESGTLAGSVELLRQGIPNYAVLSGGKGLGGPEMMEAEAALLSGAAEESIEKAYLACAVAKKNGQDSIIFCAYMLLARAALLGGNAAAFQASLNDIEQYAFLGKEFLCLSASETAQGFLYLLLGKEEKIPVWMLSMESVRKTLYPDSVPFALIVTLRHIRRHTPEELVGTAEAYIHETDELHHLLPKIYYLLEEAVWYQQNGQQENALEKVSLALSLALPDQVLLPFAEYCAELSEPIYKSALSLGGKAQAQRLRALGRRFALGAEAVRAALDSVFPLTPREREIAVLAQKNTPTKKIAETLGISPATVKNTLSKVYSKLNISGKSELEGIQI